MSTLRIQALCVIVVASAQGSLLAGVSLHHTAWEVCMYVGGGGGGRGMWRGLHVYVRASACVCGGGSACVWGGICIGMWGGGMSMWEVCMCVCGRSVCVYVRGLHVCLWEVCQGSACVCV